LPTEPGQQLPETLLCKHKDNKSVKGHFLLKEKLHVNDKGALDGEFGVRSHVVPARLMRKWGELPT
jgi:hypothetical protein